MSVIVSGEGHKSRDNMIIICPILDPKDNNNHLLMTIYLNTLENTSDNDEGVLMMFPINSKVKYTAELEKNNIKEIYQKMGYLDDDSNSEISNTNNYNIVMSNLDDIDGYIEKNKLSLTSNQQDLVKYMKDRKNYPEGDDIYIVIVKGTKGIKHSSIVIFHEIPKSKKIEVPLMHETNTKDVYTYNATLCVSKMFLEKDEYSKGFTDKVELKLRVVSISNEEGPIDFGMNINEWFKIKKYNSISNINYNEYLKIGDDWIEKNLIQENISDESQLSQQI